MVVLKGSQDDSNGEKVNAKAYKHSIACNLFLAYHGLLRRIFQGFEGYSWACHQPYEREYSTGDHATIHSHWNL
jgi:hypothetical protein